MEFSELILKRQSDRKYQDKPVARELIIKCIEAARMAPSACNSQPWTFVVVDEPELCAEMASAAASIGMNKFVAQAPVIVAVVQERMNLSARIGCAIKDKEYSLLDIGIAVEHFCLQAAELGLGTCILGWFDEKKVRKIYLDAGYKIVDIIDYPNVKSMALYTAPSALILPSTASMTSLG